MIYNSPAFWRETMKPARFLVFDARLVIFVCLFLLHMQVWTAVLLFGATSVFTIFERVFGLDFPNLLRWLRAQAAGRKRSARGRRAVRQPVDFAFELRPEHVERLRQRQARALQSGPAEGAAVNPKKSGWQSLLGLSRS